MGSLVLELQRECLDSRAAVADILRKALVVARKLAVSDLRDWISNELNGYTGTEDLPSYRWLHGALWAWDPWHRSVVPFVFKDDPNAADQVSKCPVTQSIAELEDLVRASGKSEQLEFPFHPRQLAVLGIKNGYVPTRFLSVTPLVGIVHAARNAVLAWTLKLEEDEIVGEGMSFSAGEKEKAAHANYTTNNFFAPVTNSQIQQATSGSAQSMTVRQTDIAVIKEIMKELKNSIPQLPVNAADRSQIQADVQAVEAQLSSPRPNSSVITELIASITNILEGCAGSLLASGVLQKLAGL